MGVKTRNYQDLVLLEQGFEQGFDNTFWLGAVLKLYEFYLKNMIPEILCGTQKELL